MTEETDASQIKAELIAALNDVITAALRQLEMTGKGREPSPRLQAAIDNARATIVKATTPSGDA